MLKNKDIEKFRVLVRGNNAENNVSYGDAFFIMKLVFGRTLIGRCHHPN